MVVIYQVIINELEIHMIHCLKLIFGATAVGTGLNADPDYMEKAVELLRDLTDYPLSKCRKSG